MSIDEETRQVDQVADRLAARHPDVPHDKVEQIVHAAHAKFDAGSVRDFVPLLVERSAKQTIAELANS